MLGTVSSPPPAETLTSTEPLASVLTLVPAEPPAPPESGHSARGAWLCAGAVLLLAVIVERWLLAHHTFPADTWAAQIGMSHKSWPVWDVTRIYQQVGRPLVAVGEVTLMLAWLWRYAGRREVKGLLIALTASAICWLIKLVCGPTPLWMVLAHHVGTNFPSGVVTFMTASVGYMAVVLWRQGRRRLPVALVVTIVGAGPARVVGGQHLISDVLGAYMLGAAWLLAACTYLDRPGRTVGWNIAS